MPKLLRGSALPAPAPFSARPPRWRRLWLTLAGLALMFAGPGLAQAGFLDSGAGDSTDPGLPPAQPDPAHSSGAPAGGDEEASFPPYPFTPAHLERAWQHAGDRDLLLGLGAGTAAALLIWPLDDEISDWFYDNEPLGSGAYELGREMGHRKYVAYISLGLAGGGQIIGNRHIRDTGVLYLEANFITAGFTQLLKSLTQRQRPDGSNFHSFPSGHASATMASARVLQMRFGWWVGAPAYAAATFVGLTRIQGKKHFPSDVIFAWALGFYVSSTVVRAAQPDEDEDPAPGTHLSWLPPPSFSDPGLPLVHLDF